MGKHAEKVDKLNLFLILISLRLAYLMPFDLLIFAYVILGPLHYLTEIQWLNQKNFYISYRPVVHVLLGFAMLKTFYFLTKIHAIYRQLLLYLPQDLLNKWYDFEPNILFLALGICCIFILIHRKLLRIISACFLLIGSFFFNQIPIYVLLFMTLLPTIIHTYFFTGLFMIFGTLKSQSNWGFMTVLVLLVVPFIIFGMDMTLPYWVSAHAQTWLRTSGFYQLNEQLSQLFTTTPIDILRHPIAFKIQVFISFSYLYHYLNWFSKTTVIQWNKGLNFKKISVIVGLWLGLVGVYIYDFRTGIYALYFLSILLVILEFPLNVFSVKHILKHISGLKN